MSDWPAIKAKRLLAALQRIGWAHKSKFGIAEWIGMAVPSQGIII